MSAGPYCIVNEDTVGRTLLQSLRLPARLILYAPPRELGHSGAAVRRIGNQPLKRHHRRLAFFFAVKIVAPSRAAPGSLAIGVTLISPEDIREKLVEVSEAAAAVAVTDFFDQGEPLHRTAEDVPGTFIVRLDRRMYSTIWRGRTRHRRNGTLETADERGECEAVGLNGRILIFLDGSFAAIECLSGVPQRDSVPVCPIIEESAEATQVALTPGDKVPKGGEGSISTDEPLSGSDDSDHGSHTSPTSSLSSSETDLDTSLHAFSDTSLSSLPKPVPPTLFIL
ncbi:hypothetical protein FOZ63_002821, partial [Perkinsus olseni]